MISITCCYAVVNFETFFKIQGLQVNNAQCSNTRLSQMNARRKNFSLTPKKSAKAKSSDACRLCGVNFKISVGNFGDRTRQYISTWKEKIRLADFLKIHLGVELDPQIGKSSCEHSCLTPILQDKKQTEDQNQNNLKFFRNRCYFGLSRKVMSGTFCHSSCQRSAMLWWTLLSLTPIRCCRCWSN